MEMQKTLVERLHESQKKAIALMNQLANNQIDSKSKEFKKILKEVNQESNALYKEEMQLQKEFKKISKQK